MQTSQSSQLQGLSAAGSQIAQLVSAALIGLAIIYGVGFSHNVSAHNAAHDARHSIAFPCH